MNKIVLCLYKRTQKSIQQNFSVLEWMFWATFSAYYPLLVVYLRSRGYSSTVIGTILAVNSVMVIIGQPFWGMISDRIRSIKKIFILCLGMTICFLGTLPLYESVLITGGALAVITFFETGTVPLLDNWVIQSIKNQNRISYGNIRLWGSLGFTVFVYIINLVIEHTTINSMFIAFTILGVCTIFWSIGIKDQKHVTRINIGKLRAAPLLKNKEFVLFLVFSVIMFIPMRASTVFFPTLMEAMGGSQSTLGIAMAVMSFSEVPVFFLFTRLSYRWKPKQLLFVSSLFFLLRQIFYYFSQNPIHLIGIQAMQGITFGLFLSAAVYYVDELAPEGMKSTAQTVATASYNGIGGIIGSYLGGWIIDQYGIKSLYLFGIVLSAAASVFFICYNKGLFCESKEERNR